MRTSIRCTLILLALSPALATLPAQDSRFSAPSSVGRGGARGSAALTAEEVALVATRIGQADDLAAAGRYREARTILRDVIALQERGGAYSAPALRRLANVEFGLGRPLAAAATLEELAAAANAVGDPQVELQALVDAMVIYGQEGRRSKARELRPRVEGLVKSPAIPEEMRQRVARYLITE